MCQPTLTHNGPADTSQNRTPANKPLPPTTHTSEHPNNPQCDSHHSHIANPPTLPNTNNRRKQPLPEPHHQPSPPHNPQCASHRLHITIKMTTEAAMCQPTLTHNGPADTSQNRTPANKPLPPTTHTSEHPNNPQCDSHHSHIANPTDTSQNLTPANKPLPGPNNPSDPPMCQPPLTHCSRNRVGITTDTTSSRFSIKMALGVNLCSHPEPRR